MADKVPRITIGLPIYNEQELLPGAIDSLLGQTEGDFELLISDNASTDATADICREYADKDTRIRVYRYPRNVGAPRNYNRVCDMARGEYFMWAAADDRWQPTYVQRCAEALDAGSDAVLAYTATQLVDAEGKPTEIYRDPFEVTSDSAVDRLLVVMAQMKLCNCFYGLMRRSAVQTLPTLFRRGHHAADNLLLAELALRGKFVQLPEALFIRRYFRRETNVEHHRRSDEAHFGTGSRESIRLPFCHLTKAHLDLVRLSDLSGEQKLKLTDLVITIFAKRWEKRLKAELDRAIGLALRGKMHLAWGQERDLADDSAAHGRANVLEVHQALVDFEEAKLLYADYPGLDLARAVCLASLGRKAEAAVACLAEHKRRPELPGVRKLAEMLGCLDEDGQPVVPEL